MIAWSGRCCDQFIWLDIVQGCESAMFTDISNISFRRNQYPIYWRCRCQYIAAISGERNEILTVRHHLSSQSVGNGAFFGPVNATTDVTLATIKIGNTHRPVFFFFFFFTDSEIPIVYIAPIKLGKSNRPPIDSPPHL